MYFILSLEIPIKTRHNKCKLDTGYLWSKILCLYSRISAYIFPNSKISISYPYWGGEKRLNGRKDKCNISYLAPIALKEINLQKHSSWEALVKLEKAYFIFQKWIKIFKQSCIYKEKESHLASNILRFFLVITSQLFQDLEKKFRQI